MPPIRSPLRYLFTVPGQTASNRAISALESLPLASTPSILGDRDHASPAIGTIADGPCQFTAFLEDDVASDTTMPRVGDVCSQPV